MIRRALFVILMSVCVANFSGCIFLAAGAAGVGTATWISDKVTQNVDRPLDKVIRSTRAVLHDMNAIVYKETTAPDVTQILAKDATGRQVWVDLRPIDADNTRIDVRVGYLNGENDARKILEAIVHRAKSLF